MRSAIWFITCLVLMAERDLPLEEVRCSSGGTPQKIGNLKQFHVSDHNT